MSGRGSRSDREARTAAICFAVLQRSQILSCRAFVRCADVVVFILSVSFSVWGLLKRISVFVNVVISHSLIYFRAVLTALADLD